MNAYYTVRMELDTADVDEIGDSHGEYPVGLQQILHHQESRDFNRL